MEFPHLGNNCAEVTCNKLDFLPVKCDGCQQLFCVNHMTYSSHSCPTPKRVDYQVPVCPLCNKPVPSNRGEQPDIAVNAHIERDCQSDPAIKRRKIFIRCSFKGCKRKEAVPIKCDKCTLSFCVYHRHSSDHQCNEHLKSKIVANNVLNGQGASRFQDHDFAKIQGYMSEDEALAYAIAISSVPDSSETDAFRPNRPASNSCNLS